MMIDAHFVLTESTTPGPPTNSLPDTADVSGPAEFKKLLSARGEVRNFSLLRSPFMLKAM